MSFHDPVVNGLDFIVAQLGKKWLSATVSFLEGVLSLSGVGLVYLVFAQIIWMMFHLWGLTYQTAIGTLFLGAGALISHYAIATGLSALLRAIVSPTINLSSKAVPNFWALILTTLSAAFLFTSVWLLIDLVSGGTAYSNLASFYYYVISGPTVELAYAFWVGIGTFLIYVLGVVANPAMVGVIHSEKMHSAGEESLALAVWWLRTTFKLVPVIFGTGMIFFGLTYLSEIKQTSIDRSETLQQLAFTLFGSAAYLGAFLALIFMPLVSYVVFTLMMLSHDLLLSVLHVRKISFSSEQHSSQNPIAENYETEPKVELKERIPPTFTTQNTAPENGSS